MPDINNIFTSKSLKASDLQDKEVAMTITEVKAIQFDGDPKLVIAFQGTDKTLIANKTNSVRISKMYGTNTDKWIGKQIILYPTEVEYKHDLVPAIRVKGPKAADPAGPAAAPQQTNYPAGHPLAELQRTNYPAGHPGQVLDGPPPGHPAAEAPFRLDDEVPF